MFWNYAQTFYIPKDRVKGAEYIYITSVEIFNYARPGTLSRDAAGLAAPRAYVQLCETDPLNNFVPIIDKPIDGSYRDKDWSVISNGVFIPFVFDFPVLVKTNTTYALLVGSQADAYYYWGTSKSSAKPVSGKDIQPSTSYVDGRLFQLAQGRMVSLDNYDLTFRVNIAKFNTTPRIVEFINDNMEFFTVGTVSGGFLSDELVVDANTTNIANDVVVDYITNVITSPSLDFSSQFVVGDYIVLTNNSSISDSNTTNAIRISQISGNGSVLTLAQFPTFTSNAAFAFKTPVGKLYHYTSSISELSLYESNANTSLYFTTDSLLKGALSNATATITAIVNKPVHSFNTDFDIDIPFQSNAIVATGFAKNVGSSYTYSAGDSITVQQNTNTSITTYPAYVLSRSNEVGTSSNTALYNGSSQTEFGKKSHRTRVTLSTDNEFVSPRIREDYADLQIFKNEINTQSQANLILEIVGTGNADARYVTKPITLADGLDSEDIRVFVTAYKPSGSGIDVYVKAWNGIDPQDFATKSWSPLELKKGTTSVAQNQDIQAGINDLYTEYEYGFSSVIPMQSVARTANTQAAGNAQLVMTHANLVAVGDVIRIGQPDSVNAAFHAYITALPNTTHVTISPPISGTYFASKNNWLVFKANTEYKSIVYNDFTTGNIASYFDSSGRKHQTYKRFALKIVLTSNTSYNAPRVADFRAIAVSA